MSRDRQPLVALFGLQAPVAFQRCEFLAIKGLSLMALKKIVGFDVTPASASSATSRCRIPSSISVRERLSSQIRWPERMERDEWMSLRIAMDVRARLPARRAPRRSCRSAAAKC